MYTFLTLSRKYRVNMAFLLLSLLAVISISLVNSASGGDEPEKEFVEVALHEFVKLSDVDIAFENQVLALGNECYMLVNSFPLKPIKETFMFVRDSEIMLYLYEITDDDDSIEETVRRINSLGLDCIGSPNYLTSLSDSSVWGSPHDGYGANANIIDIWLQPSIFMINPSYKLKGEGVTVTMFDSFCQGKGNANISRRNFKPINLNSKNYTKSVQATSHLTTPPPMLCGHGEAVISMVQAIAPHTNIKLYRVLGDDGFGTLNVLLEALNDFVIEGAPVADSVINLSLGVSGDSPILKEVLSAIHERGTVIVAAAGNFRGISPYPQDPPPPQYPAAYPFVIGVAASDKDGKLTSYANVGDDLLAPGGVGDCGDSNARAQAANYDCLAILNSESRISGASYWKGSSFSTALVSGLVAELLEHDSQNKNLLTPSDVKTILQCSTQPGTDGLVDGEKALDKYDWLTKGTPPCLSAYPAP